ncbi:winged helix-turn-helix transcriptional regulator [Aeromicrobium sp. CF4.19]|uniref:winged helix-turn-helix transcriptional regulator n=1 Tax=Aeromicrobium sp. CF4.19 TaxID=3373082 RepID=UPI003EE57DCE
MRSYGQFCGLARGLEVVGERWSLLIVRDLLTGPLRFGDLRDGLPGVPTNILTSRLRHLESEGVVTRRVLPSAGRSVVQYELTEHGAGLEDTVRALGRWGASTMSEPRAGEVVTDRSLAAALLAAHTGTRHRRRSFQVEVVDAVAHAVTSGTQVQVKSGPAHRPDLVVRGTGLRALLAGTLSPTAALREGRISLEGPRPLLEEFTQLFHVPLESALGSTASS